MAKVRDVVAQRDLAITAVHLPHPRAEVRWVATSELPDPSPFLEGGELLLTTGMGTKDWRSQWSAYVERLVDAGVVALGLGTGLTHRRPPRALVRACEERGLNLLDIPRETTFVAISRSTARLIEQREEAEARAALDLQRELTVAAARPDPRTAIVERLGRLLAGAACLVTPDGRPLTAGADAIDLEVVATELARIRGHGLRGAATSSDRHGAFFLMPVGLKGRPPHYLAAVLPDRPTDGQRSAVTTAVALLSFVAEQDRQRRETRRTLTARVIELLARGEVGTAQVVADAAGVPALPERLQVLRASGPAVAQEDALGYLEDGGLVAAVVEGELVAVSAPGSAAHRADTLAAAGLRVGVGEIVSPAEAAASHRTAGQALARSSPAAPVVQWDQVVREGAVALVDPEVAASFSASFLGDLDAGQVETLRSFLRHHGSRLQVASELGVHRNTVRNRVEQIESLIGRSLDDPDTRASAWLALQALSFAHRPS